MAPAAELRLSGGRLRLTAATAAADAIQAFSQIAGDAEATASERWRAAGGGFESRCGAVTIRLAAKRARGGALALEMQARPDQPVQLHAFGIRFAPQVAGRPPSWVVYNGYQSWDPAGVKPAAGKVESWWTCGLGQDDGAGLALAATAARRLATRFVYEGHSFEIAHTGPLGLDGWQPANSRARTGITRGEPVHLAASPDVREALDRAAGARWRSDPPAGWLSWYHYGPWVGRDDVLANSQRVLDADLSPGGYDLIQIDDGWQMGYGDWTPNTKFRDFAGLCQELEARGQAAGIWTAPFLVSAASDLAAQAPEDWFVRDRANGQRAVDHRHTIFGPMYVLDARRPAVREHLATTFARLRQLGVRYFKIDFLYAGAYAGIGALRAGVQAIRRGVGQDAYILACGAPLLPMKGLVEGCRIGQDTCTPLFDFESGEPLPMFFGEEIMSVARNIAARGHLSGWFQLDPDVALGGGNIPVEQARQLVTAVALSGGPYFLSDNLPALAPERMALLTNAEVGRLSRQGPARPDWQPGPADRPASIWRRHDGLIGAFNWSDQEIRCEIPGAKAPAEDLWTGEQLADLDLVIPARGVRLIRLAERRL